MSRLFLRVNRLRTCGLMHLTHGLSRTPRRFGGHSPAQLVAFDRVARRHDLPESNKATSCPALSSKNHVSRLLGGHVLCTAVPKFDDVNVVE